MPLRVTTGQRWYLLRRSQMLLLTIALVVYTGLRWWYTFTHIRWYTLTFCGVHICSLSMVYTLAHYSNVDVYTHKQKWINQVGKSSIGSSVYKVVRGCYMSLCWTIHGVESIKVFSRDRDVKNFMNKTCSAYIKWACAVIDILYKIITFVNINYGWRQIKHLERKSWHALK